MASEQERERIRKLLDESFASGDDNLFDEAESSEEDVVEENNENTHRKLNIHVSFAVNSFALAMLSTLALNVKLH